MTSLFSLVEPLLPDSPWEHSLRGEKTVALPANANSPVQVPGIVGPRRNALHRSGR